MGELNLSDDQYKKLGDLLNHAIRNRDMLHSLDRRRAAVLIFSLIGKGYDFGEIDMENIMELSGGHFSKQAEKDLKEITWVCNELVEGLKDHYNEKYRLKDFT
jgi:hypothetical protein